VGEWVACAVTHACSKRFAKMTCCNPFQAYPPSPPSHTYTHTLIKNALPVPPFQVYPGCNPEASECATGMATSEQGQGQQGQEQEQGRERGEEQVQKHEGEQEQGGAEQQGGQELRGGEEHDPEASKGGERQEL